MIMKRLLLGAGAFALISVGIGALVGSNVKTNEARASGTVEYRFSNNFSWKYIKAYAWVSSNESENNGWDAGGVMSEMYVNENSQQVFTVSLDAKYDRIVFHGRNYENNADVQTVNITIGESHGFYCAGWDNGKATVGTYNLESTYYLYDESGSLGDAPKAYAWNDNNSSKNNGYPGEAMTKVYSHNDNIYSISLDVMYNRIQFNNGSSALEQNAGQPTNGKAYHFIGKDNVGNTWENNVETVLAYGFNKTYMHMTDYDAGGEKGSQGSGTGACVGYYEDAKNAYADYIADSGVGALGRRTMEKISDTYPDSLERLSEWARINSESFSVTDKIGAFSAARNIPSSASDIGNNGALIVPLIAVSTTVLATGGFFLLRRKKMN